MLVITESSQLLFLPREARQMSEPKEHSFHHFSHQHPLEALTISPSASETITCHGCNLKILSGNDYFSCKTCSTFSLHKVCSSMPRRTRHPAHPDHYLTLKASSPPPPYSTCAACGESINSGFYYNVSGSNYHILCPALPLSIAISSHPHPLKIEFSPPYDCFCDLCEKKTSKGWIYRCHFCEFNTHISCSISQKTAQVLSLPDTLKRQIIYSSASLSEPNKKIDYESESNDLVQLVFQAVSKNSEVTKDDQELVRGIGRFWVLKPSLANNFMNPEHGSSRNPYPSSISDATFPSYQFSDMCFSIDFLKSTTTSDDRNTSSNKDSFGDRRVVPEMIEEIPAKISDDLRHFQQIIDDPDKRICNPLYMGPDKLGQINESKTGGWPAAIKGKNIGSTTVNSVGSSWLKIFTCCYNRR